MTKRQELIDNLTALDTSSHPLNVFTVCQLEALLEACTFALNKGFTVHKALEECNATGLFEEAFLGYFEHQNLSRFEIFELIEAIVVQLRMQHTLSLQSPKQQPSL